MPVSGGPTRPRAFPMPAMVWHEPQPYFVMAVLPRAGSPPVTCAAILACPLVQPLERPTARSDRAEQRGAAAARRAHPGGKQGESGDQVDEARREPT